MATLRRKGEVIERYESPSTGAILNVTSNKWVLSFGSRGGVTVIRKPSESQMLIERMQTSWKPLPVVKIGDESYMHGWLKA